MLLLLVLLEVPQIQKDWIFTGSHIVQAGLQLAPQMGLTLNSRTPTSTSQVLRLQACATLPSSYMRVLTHTQNESDLQLKCRLKGRHLYCPFQLMPQLTQDNSLAGSLLLFFSPGNASSTGSILKFITISWDSFQIP